MEAELVSEIPMSGCDAIVVINALRLHSDTCRRLSQDLSIPLPRREALAREATTAKRIQLTFTTEPTPSLGRRRDN